MSEKRFKYDYAQSSGHDRVQRHHYSHYHDYDHEHRHPRLIPMSTASHYDFHQSSWNQSRNAFSSFSPNNQLMSSNLQVNLNPTSNHMMYGLKTPQTRFCFPHNPLPARSDFEIHREVIRVGAYVFKYDRSFMNKLRELKGQLIASFPIAQSQGYSKGPRMNEQEMREKNEERRQALIVAVKEKILEYEREKMKGEKDKPNRHYRKNTDYNIDSGISFIEECESSRQTIRRVSSTKGKRDQIKEVLKKILSNLLANTYATKRDVYYQNVTQFNGSQRVVDNIVDDIACELGVTRHALHINASTKGLIYGHISFVNSNEVRVDCLSSPTGISIPSDVERISGMQSEARFVLVIEKDATFQQMIDAKIHEEYPVIMITGCGYPDLVSRAMLHSIWHTFHLPILGISDCDPHGIDIMCVYRHGSLALAYDAKHLVVPQLKWFGIRPKEILKMNPSPEKRIKLTNVDIKLIGELLQRPYIIQNENWRKELQVLLDMGWKAEIQCLTHQSENYLTYLRGKIRDGAWI